MSDIRSPIETKSPGKVLSKISAERSFDSDSGDGFDSVTPKTPPPPPKEKYFELIFFSFIDHQIKFQFSEARR
ncbi:unnamed protein product, partial [Adineta steineri]